LSAIISQFEVEPGGKSAFASRVTVSIIAAGIRDRDGATPNPIDL
jgi:hypothetical protein